MTQIIENIRNDLIKNSEESVKKNVQRFFKEKVLFYGVKSSTVSKIAGNYWKEIKVLKKPEIFSLCEELYQSDYCEEAYIVSNWVPRITDRFEIEDFVIFTRWIENYINNWAKCDGFCNHTMGNFIEKFPVILKEVFKWTGFKNRWARRGAAVSLIIPAKLGKFLEESMQIADALLIDPDDMVQKGYGWLLKEASRKHEEEIYKFVLERRKVMPRTSLRYAIELMPENMRKEAMKIQ